MPLMFYFRIVNCICGNHAWILMLNSNINADIAGYEIIARHQCSVRLLHATLMLQKDSNGKEHWRSDCGWRSRKENEKCSTVTHTEDERHTQMKVCVCSTHRAVDHIDFLFSPLILPLRAERGLDSSLALEAFHWSKSSSGCTSDYG